MGRRFKLTPPRLRLTENDVERACLDVLRYRLWRPFRLQSGLFKTPDGRFVTIGEPGIPDYVVLHHLHPGFLLETKRPGGHPRRTQEEKMRELTLGYHLRSTVADGVESLLEWLEGYEKSVKEK